MTGAACSSCMLIDGQPHAFICTPQRVIRRKLSHAWKTFYCQSSNRLFSWSGGQLDCRRSPTRVWKPEANRCGFASARPMIAEAGYVCVGICHCGSFSAHSHAPHASCATWLAAKKSLGQVASFARVLYTREAKTLMPISVD
ncbi:hypothetical protein O181_112657 [Austropuccinia psidii MF-1]|uniref:Uncharacterized protein n=1 Tax=Austropuccinia psidii MF-1 TaxID=1389203 RepID=A0A9Q3K444_9BASI|nr:hypothetical protein [Austropuccinia psidii MF-1]